MVDDYRVRRELMFLFPILLQKVEGIYEMFMEKGVLLGYKDLLEMEMESGGEVEVV